MSKERKPKLAEKLRGKMPNKLEWKTRPEILLCPNIPKPMHGLAPRVILGQKWWNATRKTAYSSTGFHCVACGVHKLSAQYHKWLEGHELYSTDYVRGELTYLETVPLCHFCHNYIHDGRLTALLQKGHVHHAKFVAIIQHGDRVLRGAGLSRPTYNERDDAFREAIVAGRVAKWEDWRLVLFGKKYPPLFANMDEWKKHHDIT